MNKFSVLNMGRLNTPYDGSDGEDREIIANRFRKRSLENYKIFLEDLKGDSNMKRKYARNEKHPDGSGVPDMPEAKWLPSGEPDFSELMNQDDSDGRRNMVENVSKFLSDKFGEAEGVKRLKIMSAEEVFKIQDSINRDKFDNSPRGSVYMLPLKERWNENGADFSHLEHLEVANDEDSFEKVRKQLHIWYGITQGEQVFRDSSFEELQSMLQNINDGKQLYAS